MGRHRAEFVEKRSWASWGTGDRPWRKKEVKGKVEKLAMVENRRLEPVIGCLVSYWETYVTEKGENTTGTLTRSEEKEVSSEYPAQKGV